MNDDDKNPAVQAENDLRKIEAELEKVGRDICSLPGSAVAHGYINLALADLRDAIHNCYEITGNTDAGQ